MKKTKPKTENNNVATPDRAGNQPRRHRIRGMNFGSTERDLQGSKIHKYPFDETDVNNIIGFYWKDLNKFRSKRVSTVLRRVVRMLFVKGELAVGTGRVCGDDYFGPYTCYYVSVYFVRFTKSV